MPTVVDLTGILPMVSAGALLAAAAVLARFGAGRPPARLLAAFALCWGTQLLTIRVALLFPLAVDPRPLALLSVAFSMPLAMFLLHFAAIHPTPLPVARRAWWPALLALPPLALLALLVQDLGAAVAGDMPGRTVFGWGMVMLSYLPFLLAQVVALARPALAWLRDPGAPGAGQHRLLALAWLMYLANSVPATMLARGFVTPNLGPLGPVYEAALLAALLAVGALAAALVARARGPERWTWLAAAAVPVLAAVAAAPYELQGLFRTAAIALLAYAVTRHGLFDLDLRLKAAARPAAMAVAGALAFSLLALLGLRLGQLWLLEPPGLLVPAGGAAVAMAVAGRAATDRALERWFPEVRASAEYLARRKVEVYRAALAAEVPPERREALARDLGLAAWQREVLEAAPSPPAEAPGEGGLLAGRYRLGDYLGAGMYGRVFEAWDERVGEAVVLKEYLGFGGPAAAEAFAREAKALGDLDHPNVLAVRDAFRAGGAMYLALERAEGGSLEQRLSARQVPEDEAIEVVRPILAGLAAAHRAGLVHRDVKPANVLYRRGVAKVADFGVAFDPVFDGALRAARAQPGTLAWMAPEQALGEGASPASDVHAAGALLYRLLAGKPWVHLEGLGEAAARRAIAERAPALPLPGVNEATNAALAKALAKDPAARFPDAGAMLRGLGAWRKAAPRAAPGAAPAGRAYDAA